MDKRKKMRTRMNLGGINLKLAVKASYTVEAVFLFPIIIFLVAFMLHLSIDWFADIQQTAGDVDALRELDTRTYFLRQEMLQGIWDSLK